MKITLYINNYVYRWKWRVPNRNSGEPTKSDMWNIYLIKALYLNTTVSTTEFIHKDIGKGGARMRLYLIFFFINSIALNLINNLFFLVPGVNLYFSNSDSSNLNQILTVPT